MDDFPRFSAILIQILGFAILYVILKMFFFGPIGELLDERERVVKSRLDEAEADRLKMIAAREDYEMRIAQIETEARESIQVATKQANAAREELLAQAREQAVQLVQKGHKELDLEKQKAMLEIRDQVVDLALLAAGKIVEKSLDAGAHRALIDDILNKVEAV